MNREEFIYICLRKFTSSHNPQVPEEYRKMYEDVFWEHHEYWLRRKFTSEVETYSNKVFDLYNSPLMKALS